ncbi:hypothetical protein [Neptunomonas sp.]|uniref:hypothetical protein n=1 Tax=Neptunomonas sp. TaxID=1971898 RepID=UPI003569A777
MRRWLKWLLIPLILILLVVGVQGYYWYQVKSDIDSLIASVRPFAKVEYADISASFLGQVSLDEITIQPQGSKNKIIIQQALLASSSRAFFLTAHEQLRTGVLDDPVSLTLLGLSYDIDADYAENLLLFSSDPQKKSLDTLLCGETGVIDQAAMQAMGYRYLQGDLSLLLESSANKKLMKVRLAAELAQFMKGEVNLWLALHQGGTLRREGLAKTAIQMLGMTVSDLGYNKRWKTFCAQQEGVLATDYLNRYRSALAENLGDGSAEYRGARLLDALASARSEGSHIAARWEPAIPLEIQKLASPKSGDVLFSSAEFALQVNGKVLELLDQEWEVMHDLFGGDLRRAALAMVESKKMVAEPEVVQDATAMKEIFPGVMPIRPPEVKKAFLETPVTDLGSYVGSPVKLRTFFGRDMEGVLVDVTTGAISIRHQVEQGRATFPVAKDKIALIEVYR